MEEHFEFTSLLFILGLAFLVPLLMSRIRWLPVVVGEMLAGVIIGRSVLGLVNENSLALELFSNIGLAFLMFLAGMEVDFSRILLKQTNTPPKDEDRQGRQILRLAGANYLFTLALAVPAGFLLPRMGLQADPWLLAFIFSATSLGVLLPVLKQGGLLPTPSGQALFFSALLADFATVLLFTIYVIILDRGLSLEVLTIGLLFVAFFVVYHIGNRFARWPVIHKLIEELSQVTVQIKVRGALAILLGFVVLAQTLGVELILGAFLAGMIISLLKTPEDADLVHSLEAFGYGFFIPIFFILVGVNLNLNTLRQSPESLLLLPALLLLSLVVKVLPALIFWRVTTWRAALASGLLLNTHLSLEVAVALIGVRMGLLSPAANAVIILFAVVSVLVMPVLFNSLFPKPKQQENPPLLIFGANDLARQVAKILGQHGETVRLLEAEPQLVQKALRAGLDAIQVDNLTEGLAEAAEDGVQGLLVLTGDDTRNLLVCHAAARLGIEHVVALVNDPERMGDYRAVGAKVYLPAMHRPALLALMARTPELFALLTSAQDGYDVCSIEIENPQANGQPLHSLGFPPGLLVLSVNRDGALIVPHGNTRLQMGDRLTLYGNVEELQNTSRWLEGAL